MGMTAQDITEQLTSLRNDEQRTILMRFFKTAPGEYGAGDEFLGIRVPQTRHIAKLAARDTQLSEIPQLLSSPWHEIRLCALLILVLKFERLSSARLHNDAAAIAERDQILKLYLSHARQANNWDLVDLSAPKLLGSWLLLPSSLGDRKEKLRQLDRLSASPCLWEQRMSIVCTWTPLQKGDPTWCQRYAEIHLRHPHDLMHKAVGWMLREMGKRCSMELLRGFLSRHVREMPRTTLRYAIEKMPEQERQYWMNIPRTPPTP